MRWSLARGGHRTNISSPAELLQQRLCGTRTIHYLLSLTLFSWVWTLYLQVIQLPASRSCLRIRMAFVKTRGHESCASSLPTVPTREITAAWARSPPEDIIRKRGKTVESPWGPPAPPGFPLSCLHFFATGARQEDGWSPASANWSRNNPPPRSLQGLLSKPVLLPMAQARVSSSP